MATIFDLSSRITLDTETFKSKLDAARRDFTKTAQTFERTTYRMGQVFQNVGSSLTRLAIAPVAFIALTTRAFAEEEAAINQLEARLKSTNGVSGQTIESLTNMASALQAVTTFGDETIMEAQGLLLTFTKVREVFPRATETMLNMSVAMKQGLKESAIQLGKALQDPIRGVTALRRVGVQLTAEQEDQIKGFVKANDILSAQTIILDELATQTGGAARKAAEGFTGQMTQMKNVVGDLAEKIGMAFTPSLSAITRKISDLAPKIQQFVTNHQKLAVVIGTVVVAATAFIGALGLLAKVIGSTMIVANGFAKFMATKWVASMLAAASANGVFAVSLGPLAGALALVGAAFVLWTDKPLNDYIRTAFIARGMTDGLYVTYMTLFNGIKLGATQSINLLKSLVEIIPQVAKEWATFVFAKTDIAGSIGEMNRRAAESRDKFMFEEREVIAGTMLSKGGFKNYQADREQAKEQSRTTDDGLTPAIRDLIEFLKSAQRQQGPAFRLNPAVN